MTNTGNSETPACRTWITKTFEFSTKTRLEGETNISQKIAGTYLRYCCAGKHESFTSFLVSSACNFQVIFIIEPTEIIICEWNRTLVNKRVGFFPITRVLLWFCNQSEALLPIYCAVTMETRELLRITGKNTYLSHTYCSISFYVGIKFFFPNTFETKSLFLSIKFY